METLNQFNNAAAGWYKLVMRQEGWRERFVLTRQGLWVAFAGYFGIVVLAILIQGALSGTADPGRLAASVVANSLPLVGAILAIVITVLILQVKVPMIEMMVPAVHALTLLLLAGFVLTIIGGILAPVLLALLGYMFYRGGREILSLSIVFALGYAALSIVLLVALPMSLYMLWAPGPGGPI
jgi:hypothetical protein